MEPIIGHATSASDVERAPWWRSAVIYQIYPRSFSDSNGDGVGDLRGISDRLDYLVALGVDAIWISPIFRSPMADFGYDISDHTDIDPTFGTMRDADHLIDAAHKRGLKVVFDLVLAHTSNEHPWFQAAASNRENEYRNYYVWADGPTPGSQRGGPPNNWMSAFSAVGPAWTWHEPTRQWYLHSHMREQPDVNWEHPAAVSAQLDIVRFWMGRGVDGVRLDAIARIGKDPELRDNVPGEPPRQQNWPNVHGHLRAVRHVFDEFPDRMTVGEVWLLNQRDLVPYLAPDELQLAHNFVFAHLPFEAGAFSHTIEEFSALAEPHVWPAWFLNNHDEPRTATRFDTVHHDGSTDGRGIMRARLAAMLMLTLRGTPFIYQGEELGLPDTPIPADAVVDVGGRDPERTPMPWQAPSIAGPGAGFTTGTPWLPIGPTAETLNVASETDDADSTLSFYRRLINLRRAHASLCLGEQQMLGTQNDDVIMFGRTSGDDHTLVVLNFSSLDVSVPLPEGTSPLATIAVSTDSSRTDRDPLLERVSLRPLEGVVVTF